MRPECGTGLCGDASDGLEECVEVRLDRGEYLSTPGARVR